jgi:hypothetical protein
MKTNFYKYAVYFLIAFGGTLAASEDPVTWRTLVACLVSGLVAVKALGSNPNSTDGDAL